MRRQWEEEFAQSGLTPVKSAPPADGVTGGVTCPACGTTAPLENGACGDCGLALA